MTQANEPESRDPEWLITPEMRARIGQEGPPVRHEVDKTTIRLYARAVGYTDRQFWDEDYAKQLGYRSLVAPPGFFGHRVRSGPEEFTGAGGTVQEDAEGRMLSGLNAGSRYVYTPGAVICAGDVLTSVGKVISLRQTTTSRGPSIIQESERVYTNQNGEIVVRHHNTQISIVVGSHEKKD